MNSPISFIRGLRPPVTSQLPVQHLPRELTLGRGSGFDIHHTVNAQTLEYDHGRQAQLRRLKQELSKRCHLTVRRLASMSFRTFSTSLLGILSPP